MGSLTAYDPWHWRRWFGRVEVGALAFRGKDFTVVSFDLQMVRAKEPGQYHVMAITVGLLGYIGRFTLCIATAERGGCAYD